MGGDELEERFGLASEGFWAYGLWFGAEGFRGVLLAGPFLFQYKGAISILPRGIRCSKSYS